jgi:ferredoxin
VSEPTTFQISAEFEGVSHRFACRSDQTVLAAAEAAGVMLPSSCCSGVCTTCAARIQEGSVHQPDAMGVKADLQQQGFALLCVAFPRSDLKLTAGQEDALYEAQFGQYQK